MTSAWLPASMWRTPPAYESWRTPPACECLSRGARLRRAHRGVALQPSRPAFTLTELLVVVAIILGLMTLLGAAVSAARNSGKISSTRATIEKLNAILTTQLATYDSRSVDASLLPGSIANKSAARAWYIRRNLISGDMPDRWTDVAQMVTGTTVAAINTSTSGTTFLPLTSTQRSYVAIYSSASVAPSPAFAGAECLFMIIMRGGIADCLDCGALRTSDIGDKDNDGMPEFWDAWGNPIGFILWPYAVELPAGSGSRFFSGSRSPSDPFASSGPSPSPTLGMRPLIYSAGPDGEYSLDRQNETGNLNAGSNPVGRDCGNWNVAPTSLAAGSAPVGGIDYRADNITNLDAEAKQ
jgi:prepilin-type N-terminal cleavage/methylation domain-containing protein